jgi:ATP-dependent DNA ligase
MSPSFIPPCLPSPADRPPSGSNWLHEIKHDGYRLMVRRDPVGIRLITRQGNDWTTRFPLVVEAVNHLKVRGAVMVCVDRLNAEVEKVAGCLKRGQSRQAQGVSRLGEARPPASPAAARAQ